MTDKTFPEDDILVALLRGPRGGMTVTELAEETDWSPTAVRDNLNHMLWPGHIRQEPWTERVEATTPTRWRLTEKGREVARYRSRLIKRQQVAK